MESKPTTYSNGNTYWRLPDGRYHRENGPAIIYSGGSLEYMVHGKEHRLDGPAVIWSNGSTYWYINGWEVTDKIGDWASELNIDLDNLTDEDKFMIRLYWENYSE